MHITIGQSADPDDAFMAWGLAAGKVDVDGAEIEVIFDDIQTLNEWALEGRLDLTALSAGTYPQVANRYRLLRAGASFGADYGPLVVGRKPAAAPGAGAVAGLRVAVPGLLTTAYMLLRTYAGDTFEPVPMRFDTIIDAVVDGSVDAGLIIHAGQLTYGDYGLHALFEPARTWHEAFKPAGAARRRGRQARSRRRPLAGSCGRLRRKHRRRPLPPGGSSRLRLHPRPRPR